MYLFYHNKKAKGTSIHGGQTLARYFAHTLDFTLPRIQGFGYCGFPTAASTAILNMEAPRAPKSTETRLSNSS